MTYQYQHIACGGTFDLLHKGHKAFLIRAFELSRQVSIGLTTDQFCQKITKTIYQNQAQRKSVLIRFLKENGNFKRAEIIDLSDIFGTTLKDQTIEALLVSDETKNGAEKINRMRSTLGLKKLKVILFSQVLARDGKKLSSGRIRDGQIDRNGNNYYSLILKIADKRIRQDIRTNLKKPLGPQVTISKKNSRRDLPLVAVGDLTVATFLKIGIWPSISIIDFNVSRERKYANLTDLGFNSNNPDVIVKNPAGYISKKLISEIHKAVQGNKKTIIQVLGEEDLATIPAILLSPLGTHVYYGQPNKGTIEVAVTEKIKDDICKLFRLR